MLTLNPLSANMMLDDLKSPRERRELWMTDSVLLRNIIDANGYKLKFVAEYLGLSTYGLQLKIDNKHEFKTSEITALCDLLKITSLKMKEKIFFKEKDDLKSTT